MKKLFLILAVALSVTACSKDELPTPEPQQGALVDRSKPTEANDFNNNRFWIMYRTQKEFELRQAGSASKKVFLKPLADKELNSKAYYIAEDAPYKFSAEKGIEIDFEKLRK